VTQEPHQQVAIEVIFDTEYTRIRVATKDHYIGKSSPQPLYTVELLLIYFTREDRITK
jgi:hypothetical protein